MASGFFLIFDDIATLLNDVAAMSKIATKKTAGILGDDLAVNSEKALGFAATRELPVIWEITKGSLLNKVLILPVVMLLSFYANWVIIPILMLGGVYLSYEGMEKIIDYFWHQSTAVNTENSNSELDASAYEKAKIKSAITTDFILSLEIIILTLSVVIEEPLQIQVPVIIVVSFLATIGVYGVVALIVRMDDFGLKLIVDSENNSFKWLRHIGQGLITLLPIVIKTLTVVGTIAMLLVAGGIFVHHVSYIHQLLHAFPSILAELIVGAVIGIIAVGIVTFAVKVKSIVIK